MGHNTLTELDPDDVSVPNDVLASVFVQDLFQATHRRFNRLVDVGWYPDGDIPCGVYGLVVMDGDFRGRELFRFDTRSRLKLVAELERVFDAVSDGHM